ncbi:MAG: hypothetical protein ABI361_04255 [Nitrososphaera sp.]
MSQSVDFTSIASLLISISAFGISLVRFRKESRLQTQADLVTALTDIVRLIDNDRAIEARGILRDDPRLKELEGKKIAESDIDEKTWEAARYVATTYDRLGFILKHDPALEKEILEWHGDVIADMWEVTGPLVMEKWRKRNPNYAREFERLAQNAKADGW